MAQLGPLFGGHPASAADCACGGQGTLKPNRASYDMARMTVDWEYVCGRCGAAATISAPANVDPGPHLKTYGQWSAPLIPSRSRPFFPSAQPSGLLVSSEPEPKAEPVPTPERTIHSSVVGYRAWRIVDWQLYGTGVNRAWVPGVNEATCDAGHDPATGQRWITFGSYDMPQHPAPAIGCHCGITALARFTTSDEHWRQVDVFGAIEAWGEDGQVVRPEPGDVAEATGLDLSRTDQGTAHEDSGGFILHHNGFRARYGKVVLLAVDEDWPAAKTAAVRALAREHGADVCRREHLEDAAKEHGQLVPDEMLEWVAKDEGPDAGYLAANVKTISGWMNVPQSLLAPSPAVWSFSTANPYQYPTYPHAAKGAHQRWHVNRGIVKDDCPYCAEADD